MTKDQKLALTLSKDLGKVVSKFAIENEEHFKAVKGSVCLYDGVTTFFGKFLSGFYQRKSVEEVDKLLILTSIELRNFVHEILKDSKTVNH